VNRRIEVHDTTLAGISYQGRDLRVHLAPAYVHASEGRPGLDPGSGWLQDVDLIVSEAVVESSPSRLPAWLSDGTFSAGEIVLENEVPFPLAVPGPVRLRFVTGHGESLAVAGAGASALPRGEPRYLEEFPGADDSGPARFQPP
jgi:hypothetical protein